ncbi:MAG TPA: hypothetical protein VG298_11730 [Acidimicrobiales bacterium]|jgi:hypothetical protein|nr:hypothetical protein [Acidimicrobiales bacterium]
MAEVTVFIDDAVRGTLPAICAKEGIPTQDRLNLRSQVGGSTGLGVAWLLILIGPIGWLGLFIIALAQRPSDYVTARLPFSEFAYRRMTVSRRLRRIWTAVTALAITLFALVAISADGLDARSAAAALGAGALAAVVMAVLASRRFSLAMVGVELDASRRWVTLTGVHPDFARAAHEQTALADRDVLRRP